MTLRELTDEDIERLLSGEESHPELASLASFVADLRERAVFEPRPGEVERTAIRAAAVVRSQLLSTRSTSLSRPGTRTPWRRLSERTTVALASLLALTAMSGVGLAADAAAPGDFLYGIDLALEELGIGDGSIDERLDEAAVLMEADDLAGAVEHLATWISLAEPDVSVSALAAAIEALEELSSDLDGGATPASAEAQEKVSELLAFIDANAGKGTGLDGKDFGQGVAEIAKGEPTDGDDTGSAPPVETDPPGNSENSNAGGNGNADDGSGEPPGNSGSSNAGGNGDDGSGESPGNSGNSNAGGNGNGGTNGSGEPPGNSGNSNAGGNGKSNGGGKP